MAGPARVYLHVGAPKTGTTYLQDLLWRNRATLRGAGVLYPGARSGAHGHAALDLQDTSYQRHADPAVPGAWPRLVDEALAWAGTVIISHELLGRSGPRAVERAMRDLAQAEVHVVCTARDLGRQIPAVWQEDAKNRGVQSYARFSAALRELDPAASPGNGDQVRNPLARLFWRYQNIPAVLRTWGASLPPERVHVVTVPRRGAGNDVLWRRFADTVGIDPALCEEPGHQRNQSMGVAEMNLMLRLNAEVREELSWPTYAELVKSYLAVDVLAARPGSAALTVPVEDRAWVNRRAELMVRKLRAAGYQVSGDLDELLPVWDTGEAEPRHPDHADDGEVLDAAVHALAGLLRKLDEERSDPSASQELRRALIHRYERDPTVRWLHDRYRTVRAKLAGGSLLRRAWQTRRS